MSLLREEILCRLQESVRGGDYFPPPCELTFDRLLRIERPEAFVFEAYRFILNREATPFEVEGKVDRLRKGVSRQIVLLEFASSHEAQELGTGCPVYWNEKRIQELLDLPRAEFVPSAYRSFLWREPDAAGQEHRLRLLDQGIPRAYVLYQIASSPEARNLGVSLPSSWIPRSAQELLALPDAGFLTCSFRSYLWRDPGANELESFSGLLGGGAPRIWVLFQLFKSAAALGIGGQFPADWLPKTVEELQAIPGAGFLPAAFRSYVWRDPDPAGFNHFSKLLARGVPRIFILYQIACSEEARSVGTEFPREWIPKSVDELSTLPDGEFLEAAYRSFLWRRPDAAGLDFYGAILAQGIPRAFVLYQIGGSPEARNAGAAFPEHWTPKTAEELLRLPSSEFLAAAYRSILWRAPDREARRFMDQLSRGRSRASVLREIAASTEAARIPFRVAGLDNLRDSRFQISQMWWQVRERIHSFVSAAFNSVLGLDRRFEAVDEAARRGIGGVQGNITSLEKEVLRQRMSADDVAQREFDILREASARDGKRLSEELHSQSRAIGNLGQTIGALHEGLTTQQAVDEHLLARAGELEGSIRQLRETVDSLADQLRENESRLSKLLEESKVLISSKLDDNTIAVSARFSDGAALLSKRMEAADSLADQLRESESHLGKRLDESKVAISLKLDDSTIAVSARLSDSAALLSKKLDDYASVLAKTISGLKRPIAIPLADNLLLTKVRDFFYFIPAEDAQLVACLVLGGHLEPGVVELLEKRVQPGMTVVDVGANIGLHSLACASRVGPEGRVYCFEPSPRLAKILRMNLVMNQLADQAVIQQVALTERPGKAAFYLKEICGHSSLYNDGTEAQTIEVRTGSLDALLPQDVNVDLVKIDAEGAEPVIIRGMSRTIARNPGMAIVLEFAPPLLERAKCLPRNFLEELHAMGFEMLRIDDATGELDKVDDDAVLSAASSNLFLRRRAGGLPVA